MGSIVLKPETPGATGAQRMRIWIFSFTPGRFHIGTLMAYSQPVRSNKRSKAGWRKARSQRNSNFV